MKRIFVYDDTVSVPADIAELAGLSAFGKLVYCRRSLAEHIADMAREAGFDRFVHLRGSGDIAALKEMMRD
ncbi:MAG: hypothetical protein U9N14_01525, partial [Pseudomonadota bacterium]|nr:hypothetical protein [Pseudomonadota bacterium]